METLSTQVVYFGSAEVPSIVAVMKQDGHPFTLVTTHPLPPGGHEYYQERNEQLESVASYVRTNRNPLILLGDLNVSPWSPHYRDFIKHSLLINSSQGRAVHPTWPTFSPLFLIPIDHCLHTASIAIKSKRVGKSIGSDHFPVIVEFGLKDVGDSGHWYSRTYYNGHVLARVIYDQVSCLEKDRSLKSGYVSLLTNTNVIYTDRDGTKITVRDLAFTILNEADEVGMPERWTPVNLIYCCTEQGEILYRAHIPMITEEGFRKTIFSLKKPSPDTLLDRFGRSDGMVDNVQLWQALAEPQICLSALFKWIGCRQ